MAIWALRSAQNGSQEPYMAPIHWGFTEAPSPSEPIWPIWPFGSSGSLLASPGPYPRTNPLYTGAIWAIWAPRSSQMAILAILSAQKAPRAPRWARSPRAPVGDMGQGWPYGLPGAPRRPIWPFGHLGSEGPGTLGKTPLNRGLGGLPRALLSASERSEWPYWPSGSHIWPYGPTGPPI